MQETVAGRGNGLDVAEGRGREKEVRARLGVGKGEAGAVPERGQGTGEAELCVGHSDIKTRVSPHAHGDVREIRKPLSTRSWGAVRGRW